MKIRAIILFLFILLSTLKSAVFANSDYVLPYPGRMPGSKLYFLSKIQERIGQYWGFGSISKSKFHIHYSDKYIVEAKILFEYNQFLLAYDALEKSNYHFLQIEKSINKAKNEKKDISQIQQLYVNESQKHIDVLKNIKSDTPNIFIWKTEKGEETQLKIHRFLDESIRLRSI